MLLCWSDSRADSVSEGADGARHPPGQLGNRVLGGSKQTRVMAISKEIRFAADDWFSMIRLSGGCLRDLDLLNRFDIKSSM